MIHLPANYNDSEISKILLHLPVRLCLIIYFLTLPISDLLSESFVWISCIATLIYISINMFAKERKFQIFRLGIELSLFLFLLAIFMGWWLNDGLIPQNFFHLRWILFLYLLTFILDIFPSLNLRIFVLVLGGVLAAGFALLQCFSSEVFALPGLINNPTESPWPDLVKFSAQGLFENREDFGVFLAMIAGFPTATLFFRKRISRRYHLAAILAIFILSMASILTFSTVAWTVFLGTLASVLLMNRKTFFAILLIVLAGLSTKIVKESLPADLSQRLIYGVQGSDETKRKLMKNTIEIFKANIWFGAPPSKDSEPENSKVAAPNTYFQLLAFTGILGFITYMLLCLSFLFLVLQLWQEVSPAHTWHRVILLGSLACQVTFHLAGLYVWTLGKGQLLGLFIFSLAVTAYLSERYGRGIVSDDYSL